MDSLSHVKNEKSMLRIEQSAEYTKLVAFINEFLDIGDSEKTQKYLNYLIKDLKILTLADSNKKIEKEKKKAEEAKKQHESMRDSTMSKLSTFKKLPEQKEFEDKDSALSFGSHDDEDILDLPYEHQSTRATLFSETQD